MIKNIVLVLSILIVFSTLSCTTIERPVESILDSTSLQNGSVALYHIKDKNGKVIKLVKNHVVEETSHMLFVQEYSASDSEELLRVRLSPKTLNLDYSEIVSVKTQEGDGAIQNQEPISSVERSGSYFFLSSIQSGKKVQSRIMNDSLVMEQEIMVYLLNCFPFHSLEAASIPYINVRKQTQGIEKVVVDSLGTLMHNKQNISVYKVILSDLGGTAWYMEEKPHILVGADFPSYTIQLSDWNGR